MKDNFNVLIERKMLLLAETGQMLTLGKSEERIRFWMQ